MRILHIVYIPRFSGAEVLVRDLSLIHQSEGHQVAVCSFLPAEASFAVEITEMERAGIRWFLPDRALVRLERLKALCAWRRDFKPDVVVAHSAIPAAYAKVAFCLRRLPHCVEVVHAPFIRRTSLSWRGAVSGLFCWRIDALVTVDAAELERRKKGKVWPSRRRMRHIANGLDLTRFTAAEAGRAEARVSLGLESDHELIVQAGRIALDHKQQHLTVAALSPLLRQRPQARLFMAGILERLDHVERLKAQIHEEQLDERILILGPRRDIPNLLAAADAYVMPSSREAHSVAFLEAMATGPAIVASNISVFEFARAAPGVTLIDPNDLLAYRSAVEHALDHRVRYRRDMSEYTIERTAQAYLALFEELLAIHASQDSR